MIGHPGSFSERRHTSEPSRSGRPRSNRTRSDVTDRGQGAAPVPDVDRLEAVARQPGHQGLGDRRIVFHHQDLHGPQGSTPAVRRDRTFTKPLPSTGRPLERGSVPLSSWHETSNTTRKLAAGVAAVVLTMSAAGAAVAVNLSDSGVDTPAGKLAATEPVSTLRDDRPRADPVDHLRRPHGPGDAGPAAPLRAAPDGPRPGARARSCAHVRGSSSSYSDDDELRRRQLTRTTTTTRTTITRSRARGGRRR